MLTDIVMILNTIFVPSFPHPLPLYFYNNISLRGWLSHPTASLITKKPLQPPLPSITQKTHPCIPLRFPISKSKHSVFRAPANTERYVRVYNNPVSVPRAAVPIFVFVHECYVGRLRLHRSSRGDETSENLLRRGPHAHPRRCTGHPGLRCNIHSAS